MAPRPGRRGPRPALRRSLAQSRTGIGPTLSSFSRPPLDGCPGRAVRLEDGLGATPMSLPLPGVRASCATPGSKPEWLAWSCEEQRATREAVARLRPDVVRKDLDSGPRRRRRSCNVSAAPMSLFEPGHCVYTAMLNHRGGYEADVTVTRTADDSYLMVTGSASIVRDIDWLRRHIDAEERVSGRRRDGVMRCLWGHGSAFAGPPAVAHRHRPVRSRRFRSRRASRSTSGTRPCGPLGSPTWVNSDGSFTFRWSWGPRFMKRSLMLAPHSI